MSVAEANVRLAASTDRLKADLADATSSLQGFAARAQQDMTRGMRAAMAGMQSQAKAQLDQIGSQFQAAGRKWSMAVTAPLVGIGTASAKMAMDFEKSFAQIQGLVGATTEELGQYREAIQGMVGDTSIGAQELADALYFITSAGLSGSTAIQALEVSAKAAAAGLGETKVVADAVTSAVNAYEATNLTAAEATDILVAAVREGKVEADQLAGAMGRVLPVASQMGVEFYEVGAAVAAMTRVGLDANESVTALRAMMTTIQNPTSEARRLLDQYGLSASDLRRGIEEDLLGTLRTLGDTFSDNEEALTMFFGNVRASTGVMNLLRGEGEATQEIFDRMADSAGSLDDAFAAMAETAGFQAKTALEELKLAGILLGQALLPVVRNLSQWISRLAESLSNMSPEMRQFVIVAGMIAAAVGPLLLVIGSLIKTFSMVKFVIAPMIAALGGISAPILALIAVVVALAVAFATNFAGIRDAVMEVVGVIWDELTSIATLIRDEMTKVLDSFGADWSDVLKWTQAAVIAWSGIVSAIWRTVAAVVKHVVLVISGYLQTLGALIRGDFTGAWQSAKDMIIGIWNNLASSIGNITAGILRNMAKAMDALGGNGSTLRAAADGFASRGGRSGQGGVSLPSWMDGALDHYSASTGSGLSWWDRIQKQVADSMGQSGLTDGLDDLINSLGQAPSSGGGGRGGSGGGGSPAALAAELTQAVADATIDLREEQRALEQQIQRSAEAVLGYQRQLASMGVETESGRVEIDRLYGSLRDVTDEAYEQVRAIAEQMDAHTALRDALLRERDAVLERGRAYRQLQDQAGQIIASLRREIELSSDATREQALAYDLEHGALRDLEPLMKSYLLDLARQVDLKAEAARETQLLAEAEQAVAEAARRQRQVFSDYMGDLAQRIQVVNGLSEQALLIQQLLARGMNHFQARAAAAFQLYVQKAESAKEQAERLAEALSESMTRAFSDILDGSRDFFSALLGGFRRVLADIGQEILRAKLQDMIFGAIRPQVSPLALGPSFFSSLRFRAAGGPVMAGNAYVVGEQGPEMFVPGQGGRVVPNHQMGGGTYITINIQTSDAESFRRSRGQILSEVGKEIARATRRNR